MEIEYYERIMRKLYEAKIVSEGLNDIESGRTADGDAAIDEIRGKYGI